MGDTNPRERTNRTPPDGAPLRRAWVAVALVPVFFLLALAVARGLYSVMGYLPENDDAP